MAADSSDADHPSQLTNHKRVDHLEVARLAMGEHGRHATEGVAIHRMVPIVVDDPCDAAHRQAIRVRRPGATSLYRRA